MLVLGVEEDPLGVRVDVGAGGDEQRREVPLPPLDGDVQRRLPCGPSGADGGSAAETLVTSPVRPPHPPRNRGETSCQSGLGVASHQEPRPRSLPHSFLRASGER